MQPLPEASLRDTCFQLLDAVHGDKAGDWPEAQGRPIAAVLEPIPTTMQPRASDRPQRQEAFNCKEVCDFLTHRYIGTLEEHQREQQALSELKKQGGAWGAQIVVQPASVGFAPQPGMDFLERLQQAVQQIPDPQQSGLQMSDPQPIPG